MFFLMSKGPGAPPDRIPNRLASAAGPAPAPDPRFHSPFHAVFDTEEGPMFDPFKIPGSRSLHERRLATWALLIGETHSSAVHAETRRRPHRGMLPDVDFSQAVPDYSRPSLVRRIMQLIRPHGGAERAPAAAGRESADAPVGEMPRHRYIGQTMPGGPDGVSGPPGFDAPRFRAA
jgi:hypothetical protein